MDNSYKKDITTQNYLKFLESESGKFFQKLMFDSVFARLAGLTRESHILDAGAGTGWLAHELSKHFSHITACDNAGPLLTIGKQQYPSLSLQEVDLTQNLPYADSEFDAVVMAMVLLDLPEHMHSLYELRRVLKPGGLLVATTVNPYYGYPVGVWKRGMRRLFGGAPKLQLTDYFTTKRKPNRSYTWGDTITSHFYTLPEYVNNMINAGFTITYLQDLESTFDNQEYGLQHQLYRFPTLILLEAKK